jgi:hypothetical protein
MPDTLTRTCTRARDWDPYTASGAPDLAALTPCGEPAAAQVLLACVHEHVDRALACVACAVELQRMAGVLICGRCEDLCEGSEPGPHECLQSLRIEWFSGEVTDG